jgi:TfoX/Sxy family transcriptional regulator of competence genes
MPHDAALAEAMRRALRRRKNIVEKKMFGGICWMQNGKMLCGVETDRFMFRVGVEQQAEALAKPGAAPMDFTGKPMKGFVWVRADQALKIGLSYWINLASRYVAALPAK